jgi:NADH:ubiquinone oxidoreductase subunit
METVARECCGGQRLLSETLTAGSQRARRPHPQRRLWLCRAVMLSGSIEVTTQPCVWSGWARPTDYVEPNTYEKSAAPEWRRLRQSEGVATSPKGAISRFPYVRAPDMAAIRARSSL